VCVLLDAQPFLDDPVNQRLIREIALDYDSVHRTLVFVSSTVRLTPDLQRMSATFRLLLPEAGALYNKFHGETERNLRDALETAEAMAPCVLWLDEIEKGLSTSGDSSDGGVSRRVLGTLLTWMSDRKSRVFMVATANDISRLPPELMRKGRFDEIFFVDLPTEDVRAEIFRIHLSKRAQDPAQFDLATLARIAVGFSGAEIEQVVIAGLYEAHANSAPLSTGVLENEIRITRPLSVVRAEEVEELREWAAERTVMAD